MADLLRKLFQPQINDKYYSEALHEFIDKRVDEGTFARAVADSDGSESSVRAHYIRLRARRLAAQDTKQSAQQMPDESESRTQPRPRKYREMSHEELSALWQAFVRRYPNGPQSIHSSKLWKDFLVAEGVIFER